MVFIGLTGSPPRPSNLMTIRISLMKEKRRNWHISIARIVEAGAIAFAEIESIIGRLSPTQTSVFGRIGGAMLAPLYTKLRPETYRPLLSQKELTAPRWWAAAIAHMRHRKIRQMPPSPERSVYTDAACKSRIIAASMLTPGTFGASNITDSVTASRTANARWETFGKTCYIYGLEILAAPAIRMAKNNGIADKTATFYIDNNPHPCANRELREPHRDSGNNSPNMDPGPRPCGNSMVRTRAFETQHRRYP